MTKMDSKSPKQTGLGQISTWGRDGSEGTGPRNVLKIRVLYSNFTVVRS